MRRPNVTLRASGPNGVQPTEAQRLEIATLTRDAAVTVGRAAARTGETDIVVFGRAAALNAIMPLDALCVDEASFSYTVLDRERFAQWLEAIGLHTQAGFIRTGPPDRPCPPGWRLAGAAITGPHLAITWVPPFTGVPAAPSRRGRSNA